MAWNDRLKIKIFADGAELDGIKALAANPLVKGFTTNPSLMRKAGVDDYEGYARRIIAAVPNQPLALEVFADDFDEMIAQGRVIASWGSNVNVTAMMTAAQVENVAKCLVPSVPAIISVFAGRVADTGIDPVPVMQDCLRALADRPKAELLWASPRELLNIFQADAIGCHIITVSHDVLAKLSIIGKDLDAYSLETVKTFYRDAQAAGFKINLPPQRAAS
jgi:transaldolase